MEHRGANMNMRMRQFHGPSDWGWVQQHVPLLRVQDTCGIIAIDEDKDETVGAFIVDNILNNSVNVTLIITNSMILRHGFMHECCDWIFGGLGKDYAYSMVAETNVKAIRINKRSGGEVIARIKEGFKPGVDFLVYEFQKSRCPFYKETKKEVA